MLGKPSANLNIILDQLGFFSWQVIMKHFITLQNIFRQVIRNVLRSDTVWLGLNDIVSEGRFFWVDGDPFRPGELAWINADQPDNQVGNEDCMEFNLSGYAANAINDLVCNRNKRGLCEKPVQY